MPLSSVWKLEPTWIFTSLCIGAAAKFRLRRFSRRSNPESTKQKSYTENLNSTPRQIGLIISLRTYYRLCLSFAIRIEPNGRASYFLLTNDYCLITYRRLTLFPEMESHRMWAETVTSCIPYWFHHSNTDSRKFTEIDDPEGSLRKKKHVLKFPK